VINHEEERAYVAAGPELLRDFARIGLDSKRNVPLSARVKCILERRHKEAGKPQMGLVFGREDGSAVPNCSIDMQHDRTLDKLELRFRIYDCRPRSVHVWVSREPTPIPSAS
jgi:hypothetical protein